MNRSEVLPGVFAGLAKYPYLWALGVCLCFQPFLLGTSQDVANYALWSETLLVIGAAAIFGMYTFGSGKLGQSGLAVFGLAAILAAMFICRLYAQNQTAWDSAGIWAALIIVAFVLITLYLLRGSSDFSGDRRQMDALMIIGLGFFLKLFYVLITTVYTRQHDVGVFEENNYHAGYIEYLLASHQLPDFDIRGHWQFYHPPLHHAISAAWIYINENVLALSHNAARESLQTLTLFYSMCIIILAYRILRYFKLEGRALYIPLILISFHPTFILFSGSINNDVLSVALIMGAVLSTLEWYRNQTMAGIMKIALCIGLGMMTKISAAVVAPPVALVFLIALIQKHKTHVKKLMVQYVCFGLVCFPLGLWFGLRNYLTWGIPITYVPRMSENATQYIGDMNFMARVTDFSAQQFASPYIQWEPSPYPQEHTEYNPLIALLKSSLFGQWKLVDGPSLLAGTLADVVPFVFFWTNVAIAGFALVSMLVICFGRFSDHRTGVWFLFAFYVVLMISFYKMAADFPFTCTLLFRYISPTAIVGAVFIGLYLKSRANQDTRSRKVLSSLLEAGTCLFAVLAEFVCLAIE